MAFNRFGYNSTGYRGPGVIAMLLHRLENMIVLFRRRRWY